MLDQPTVSIVIVNWNAGYLLSNCLNSIQRYGGGIVDRVIVVDNGSTDMSLEGLRDMEGAQIVETGENLGFAKACNLGASYCSSRYLLFLNPDAALHEHTLSSVIEFMENPANTNIGICGVRLVDGGGRTTTSAARFPTLRVVLGTSFGLDKIWPKTFPSHLMKPHELAESKPVDQIMGAFFLMRSGVFKGCGGFDERFFIYFEEVDLSLRARQLGWISYILTDVTAYHKGGGSSDAVKDLRLFYLLRSRNAYAHKHYSFLGFLALQLITAMELPVRLLKGILAGSFGNIKSSLSAYLMLLKFYLKR